MNRKLDSCNTSGQGSWWRKITAVMAVLTLFVSELSAQSYAVIGTGTASNTATSNSPVMNAR
ncbi:MAG TPA: hypothetical protein PLP28_08835, partial [Flavobacteriales bacterium]|nr:hypothetical protein [Flavobacteriales bacterium]